MHTKTYLQTITRTLFSLIFITISYSLFAQFTYQAVVRNGDGDLIENKTIGVKITITEKQTHPSSSSEILYSETHSATSNDNGLISIIIGEGSSKTGDLENVNWSGQTVSNGTASAIWDNELKVEYDLNGGTNYTLTATEIIREVPRAAFANEAETASNGAIAYAFISSDATISAGVGIKNCEWDNSAERYLIEFTDISYFYNRFITVVTPTSAFTANCSSMGGKMIVTIYDENGDKIKGDFQFATFKP